VQDLAINSQQSNSVRMRQRDEFTVVSGTIASGNELKNRRARHGELLSVQHGRGEIRDGDCLSNS
jgi:hypothetical protein